MFQSKNEPGEQPEPAPSRPQRKYNWMEQCDRRKSSSLSRLEGIRCAVRIQQPKEGNLGHDSEYCTFVSSSLETIGSLAEWVNPSSFVIIYCYSLYSFIDSVAVSRSLWLRPGGGPDRLTAGSGTRPTNPSTLSSTSPRRSTGGVWSFNRSRWPSP